MNRVKKCLALTSINPICLFVLALLSSVNVTYAQGGPQNPPASALPAGDWRYEITLEFIQNKIDYIKARHSVDGNSEGALARIKKLSVQKSQSKYDNLARAIAEIRPFLDHIRQYNNVSLASWHLGSAQRIFLESIILNRAKIMKN